MSHIVTAQSVSSCSSGIRKSPDKRRHVAHRLLIELLACQFAFPVRWIETQDVLFSKKNAISRFIEIGPAKILAGMAKQTAELKYADQDLARSIRRKFLSSESDSKDIYYEYEATQEETPSPTLQTEAEAPVLQPSPIPVAASAPTASVQLIPDVPILARDIVRSLVAQKFNKAFDDIAIQKSIKDLAGGKSTLQNELVGILEAEFPNVPPGPEDLSIAQLGEDMQPGFRGDLGKESSRLLSRLFSAKMPAGFGQGDARSYVEQTWGLGPGRQTALFLLAVTIPPASRLPSIDSAKGFIDAIVPRYATLSETVISKAQAPGGQHSAVTTVVDSEQMDKLRKDNDKYLSKHLRVLADQLKIDVSSDKLEVQNLRAVEQDLRSRLDLWSLEFGEEFENGIQPAFDVEKKQRFDCWWNNVREDVIRLYHDIQISKRVLSDPLLESRLIIHTVNRADAFVVKLVENLTQKASEAQVNRGSAFENFGKKLLNELARSVTNEPVFKYTHFAAAPQTTINPKGVVEYTEVPRSSQTPESYTQTLRNGFKNSTFGSHQPFVHIRSKIGSQWRYDTTMTESLLSTLERGTTTGLTFSGKTVLVTGAGPNSIGAELLRGLLMGGARVIVTTSRQPSETKSFYQSMYAEYGSRGSELEVFTFNQGSKRDCASLVDHIYSESGLNRNLDAIIPFAAISERGEVDELAPKSELAHRLMLTNIVRILGHVARNKASRAIDTCPTQVLLPLSPNHGVFGGDGLYAESKLGLESLLDKFHSENWSNYLSICGAVIGWTRGTDLMAENDLVAQAIEAQNALTFSSKEMAFNLLALLSPEIVQECEMQPLWADVSGALGLVPDLKGLLAKTRADINKVSAIRKAVAAEDALEALLVGNKTSENLSDSQATSKDGKKSNLKVGYPKLPDYEHDILPLQHLEGMVDLSSVPVVVGFSELGPWGSSRTRWEMESRGAFSQEGYIEMAWMMNLIKFSNGDKASKNYVGWMDAKTGAEVRDDQVAELYGPHILAHSGIRLVEPELLGGYDPEKKEFMHEVAIEEDLPEFEAPVATAEAFKLRHGDGVSIRLVEGTDTCKIRLKRGTSVMIAKAVPFEGSVAGQIPTGWNASKYGLPEDIVRQVDPVTAYALCCAAEALYSAGISDASELLQHMHISEIGNFVGSMMGGTTKTRNMYKDRYLDKDVQGDVMQETYLNTTAAWINMLLLGTAGPIKTPTGACATGIESIDDACESLLCGKTKLCFVGGTDDFQEEESYAFRTMKATVDATEELAKGRLPSQMSRPTAETRSGFVESQGSGMQILTTADMALSMGLPIYAVIASSTMASDKISRSVPAPGQGVLSFARETNEARQSPLLSMDYRRHEMRAAVESVQVSRNKRLRKAYADSNKKTIFEGSPRASFSLECSTAAGPSLADTVSAINASAELQIKDIRRIWGNDIRRQNPEISPLRAALATWGLTVDDINIASLHGTSTKANDKNEPDIINKQMTHLQRLVGNPILAICQKSVTGHPKAPAASFMLNGCLQVLNTGLVPGNRNADNVDPALAKFSHITFPTRNIQTSALKAFSLTSFGFGQKGGQLVGIHPRYLYGVIDRPSYDSYATRVTARTKSCNRAYLSAMMENRIVACKTVSQYLPGDQDAVLLDPYARVSSLQSQGTETWHYDPEDLRGGQIGSYTPPAEMDDWASERDGDATLYSPIGMSRKASELGSFGELLKTKSWLEEAVAAAATGVNGNGKNEQNVGVGIDVEEILSAVDSDLQGGFVQRNFTASERAVAASSPDPKSTLTGRWSAKEAVFKSLSVKSKGAGTSMRDIEILRDGEGKPVVKLHGDAYSAAQDQGIRDIQLSLSHSDNTAIAVALAIRGIGQPTY